MATKTQTQRSRTAPKTKGARLTRVGELTERIDARLAEVESLADERDKIVVQLRDTDGATFREIADAAGKTEQAIHKAYWKRRNGS